MSPDINDLAKNIPDDAPNKELRLLAELMRREEALREAVNDLHEEAEKLAQHVDPHEADDKNSQSE